MSTIRLFDIDGGKVVPTEHCFTINHLKRIMDEYPDNYITIYAYLFYMTCPDPESNPYFNIEDDNKQDLILKDVDATFDPDEEPIRESLAACTKMYETTTTRAFKGIKNMLDRLATYMENTPITHGRDGNITALINAASKYQQIRESYKGAYSDLQDEQLSHVRGGAGLAYDQRAKK